MHTWSHPADQPSPEDEPPSYLRGWNHVEVDANGNLFAIVPLRSLLKLTPWSELEWSCDVAAHHDVAVGPDGVIRVLTEAPRRVAVSGQVHVVLDNLVTLVDPGGVVRAEVSIYDILRTDPYLRRLIDDSILHRSASFRRRGWPTPGDVVRPGVVEETREILSTGHYDGERRIALRRLRALPGSPCDVLHSNTLEVVEAHPGGLWDRGDVLLCMRELDTIAVVDPIRGEVRWSWGVGQLSSPHQPSVLPDGRVLVFDNGVEARRTRLVVVDPCSGDVVWSWSAQPPQSFFCPLAGGCERLPGGNLLVTDSTAGGAFELTMGGDIVWRLTLPPQVYGRERGRVSIYRMSTAAPELVARIIGATTARSNAPARGPAGPVTTDLGGGSA